MTVVIAAAALLWWALVFAPWRPWRTDSAIDAVHAILDEPLTAVTALVPARNEAPVLRSCISALRAQGPGLRVIVVDDESSDGTADIAAASGARVIRGRPVPPGWSGKVWALEQGRAAVETEYLLLIDADVVLDAHTLPTLLRKMRAERLGLVSIYPAPRFDSFWDKLLMPAFVYFFGLLYPFRLSNSPRSRIAAASGGCILLECRAVEAIGGFGRISDALIDDCALAARVKAAGYRTWIGLTHSARGLRSYERLGAIGAMVERTAYTQLRYSVVWLLVCSALMILAFCVPLAGLFYSELRVQVLAVSALAAMAVSYVPTLRFYARSPLWVLCMPLIGIIYLGMTWRSAVGFYRRERARWKGRVYS
jgi:hopene-associated glycosyltransferase HpnB